VTDNELPGRTTYLKSPGNYLYFILLMIVADNSSNLSVKRQGTSSPPIGPCKYLTFKVGCFNSLVGNYASIINLNHRYLKNQFPIDFLVSLRADPAKGFWAFFSDHSSGKSKFAHHHVF